VQRGEMRVWEGVEKGENSRSRGLEDVLWWGRTIRFVRTTPC